MVSKAFFEIDENYTINKAIVDVDRPAISGFDQRTKCTV